MERSRRKRHRPNEVVAKLRQPDEALAKGLTIAAGVDSLGRLVRIPVVLTIPSLSRCV